MEIADFINILVSLLVIANPLVAFPAVLMVTSNHTVRQKQHLALLSSLVATGILVAMVWGGPLLLTILGLKLESFQIAGGLVIVVLGFSLLSAKVSPMKTTQEEQDSPSFKTGAVIPLAFPLITGPGAISTVIVSTANFPTFTDRVLITCACLVVGATAGFLIYNAERIERTLGKTGVSILGRIGGLILLTLGIQIIMSAVLHFFPGLAH